MSYVHYLFNLLIYDHHICNAGLLDFDAKIKKVG